MENYIVINGKKSKLTEEQLEKLGIKPDKNKYEEMFELLDNRKPYFFINDKGEITDHSASFECSLNDARYACGNVCKDKDIMKQRALHETLNRLLWRASVIAGELDNPWDGRHYHLSIYRDIDGQFFIDGASWVCKHSTEIYFPTKESAEETIENIIKPFMKEHPDFVW